MKKLIEKFFGVQSFLPKSGAMGEVPSRREAYGNLLNIALPSILEMALMSLIGSIDTAMVGTIGTAAIAAVGLVGQPRMLMLCVFFALNVGVTAIVARRRGEERQEEANKTLRTAIMLVTGISIVMTALGLIFSRQLMQMAGAAADTIDDAEVYFRILMYFLPANALSMGICAAQRGVGNTRITMYVNIVSNLLNVLFNFLLINGIGPFPRLGVRGAAIATVIGFSAGLVLSVVSLLRTRHGNAFLRITRHDDWHFSTEAVRAIAKVGGNAMLEQVALRVGFFLYARIVANLGTQAFASHQICMQFLNISFSFGDGIGVAGTALVGQMLGRKRPDLAQIYGKVAQRVALLVSLLLASTLVCLRYPLIGIFSSDASVIRLSAEVMLLVAIFQPFQTSSVVISGALRGAGDTRYVAIVMMLCVSLIRPTLAALSIYLIQTYVTPAASVMDLSALTEAVAYWGTVRMPEIALMGAWAASLVDMILRMSLMIHRFNGGKWHGIKV